jgi:energy-coupling factor transporter ATP-binding protein EcfA2
VVIYDLHSLGWHSFQQLCLTISREVFGQTVQTFLNSKDGGRDGAFAGKWTPQAGEHLSGRFVIQCKFTSKAEKALRLPDVADELAKARRLVEKKRCDCYLLLTNFNISGISEEKIEDAFREVGVKQFRCFGAGWISQQIRERKRLRMLVPRVYGLGDLSQILDGRAYSQARALLDSMREDLSKVVLTAAYDRAVRALEAHGFVLLLGEPASGKTTIAAMLAMAAIDQWKVSTLRLETSQQIIDRWDPEDPFQFFWVDDAFGVTQYELPLVLDWNRIFPKVKAMINAGARIVLTSRDYIYKRAKPNLKESAFPLMRESQVVIDVHDITGQERRQILYNHIKLGNQPRDFRSAIKPYLEHVASHPRFAPETARRLGNSLFTRGLSISQPSLTDFVERQEQLLQEVIEGLDKHSQASLALIFMRNGALESPVTLRASEDSALVRLGPDLGETIAALGAMQDSLTVNVREDGRALWKFKHPTVGDAYASILLKNPELLDIYIEGAPPEKLIGTITCGNIGLEGAVVVPKSLYEAVAEKLSSFVGGSSAQPWTQGWERERKADRFLAGRCDREFLGLYLERHPQILERVSNPGLFLYAVSEVELALTLFEFGLLPEQHRRKFVHTVIQYTVQGDDGYVFENPAIRKMFTPGERKDLTMRLRSELVPSLATARSNWEDNFQSDEDPESYMQPFGEILSALERKFATDKDVTTAVSRERVLVERWIRQTLEDIAERDGDRGYEEPEYDLGDHPRSEAGVAVAERSIFDDIDL